jgi:eukaryotic-like serine/threonine-protein kinase
MSVDRLADLLLRWEELREKGQTITPEDLCRDAPELLPEVCRRIVALERMELALDVPRPTAADTQAHARTMPSEEPLPPATAMVPGYEIVSELGRGGMGVVYKAWQKSLNRYVALKMMLSGAHAGTLQRQRFRREAEAAAHLHHPNIVQVYEVGEHDRQLYFSLEFVEGYGLNDVIHDGVPPFAWSAAIMEKLALAVDYANRRGIVHRDLKPANVLIEGSVRPSTNPVQSTRRLRKAAAHSSAEDSILQIVPKITDFGLAKRLDDDQVHTRTGDVVGTPSYMAPEQAAGLSKSISASVDIYALGAMLYELLTGTPPFEGDSPWETVHKVINLEPTAPSRRNSRTPKDLETICLKCLQKTPAKRYATGLALAEDLRRFLNGEPIAARPIGMAERGMMWVRRRPGLAALFGLCGVLVLALLVGGWVSAIRRAQTNSELTKVNQENHRALIRLNVTQGLHYLDDEELFGSLIWFARALTLENDARLEQTHRVRLASVLSQCPHLKQLWFHGAAVTALAFSPDGQWVLTGSDDGMARILNLATGASRQEPIQHKQAVLCAAFNKSGDHVVTGSLDRKAYLWDAATGRLLATFVGHDREVVAVCFSPDGAQVLTASADATARVWDATSGAALGKPLQHHGPVVHARFAPDGKTILTASEDGQARLWVFEQGAFVGKHTLQHEGAVHDAIFSPDGLRVATAGADNTARIWDTASGKPLTQPLKHYGPVLGVCFSPDGRRLATASADLCARVWDCEKGQTLVPMMRHYSAVSSARFSPDGKRLVTASDDNSARVWDSNNGRPLTPPITHNGEVGQAIFSPNGRFIATGAEDTTARVYELEPEFASIPTMEQSKPLNQAAFDPDGKRILTAGSDGLAILWDARTGGQLVTLKGHKGSVQSASFSARGERVVTASVDGTARIWEAASGKVLLELKGHSGPVRTATFNHEGSLVVTASDDSTARIWDSVTGQTLHTLRNPPGEESYKLLDAKFSPDGRFVATAGADRAARLWDVSSGAQVGQTMHHLEEIVHIAFSPDGLLLGTASDDRTARLWYAATGKPALGAPLRHAGPVRDVSFSPDSTLVVTSGNDNTARVWSASTGELTLPPLRHAGSVTTSGFTPDGKRLMTASNDNTARVWDAETGEPITPPLGHRHWGRITSIDSNAAGDRFATASADGTAEIWQMRSIDMPASDLERLAQLLCGSRIGADGSSMVPLDADTLRSLWQEFRERISKAAEIKP